MEWHFAKVPETEKCLGTMIAHLIRASHSCWKPHKAMDLCHEDGEGTRKTMQEEEQQKAVFAAQLPTLEIKVEYSKGIRTRGGDRKG